MVVMEVTLVSPLVMVLVVVVRLVSFT